MKRLINYYPLVIVITILIASTTVSISVILNHTGGNLVYNMDDPYIHMTIAKNLVNNGNYAYNNELFTSASSSPLWVMLISAVFYLFGVNEITPLIFNILFAMAGLLIADYYLKKNGATESSRLLCLVILFMTAPMLALIFIGMEHLMHIVFIVPLIFVLSADISGSDKRIASGQKLLIVLLAFLSVAARYESCFLISAAFLMYIIKKRILFAFVLAFSGFLPILIIGLISVSFGWHFLPSSILLKANLIEGSIVKLLIKYLFNLIIQLSAEPGLYISLALISMAAFHSFLKKRMMTDRVFVLCSLYIMMLMQHLLFAKVGEFYRYEAYLIFSGVIVIATIYKEYIRDKFAMYIAKGNIISKIAFLILITFLVAPLFKRGLVSSKETIQASYNIYEQQYQIARFLRLEYNNEAIGMNDIGATGFYTDARIVDLWGLGNIDITNARRHSKWNSDFIDIELKKKNSEIMIVYDEWFNDYNIYFEGKWLKAGEWQINNNVVCGDERVAFYAKDSVSYSILLAKLAKFSKNLPEGVIERGDFTLYRL